MPSLWGDAGDCGYVFCYHAALHQNGVRNFFTAEGYKLSEDAQRSFYAYKHESKPVAIYALSEHLLALKRAKDIPVNARLLNDRGLYLELMLTHARVAKLYAETEQPT